jgi:hypothetical protein
MLLLGFLNSIASALHQHYLSIALSIAAFAVPVIAGYEVRKRGGSYGDALGTAWLTITVDMVIAVPLGAMAFLTSANSLQLPPGLHPDPASYPLIAVGIVVLLAIIAQAFEYWLLESEAIVT